MANEYIRESIKRKQKVMIDSTTKGEIIYQTLMQKRDANKSCDDINISDNLPNKYYEEDMVNIINQNKPD